MKTKKVTKYAVYWIDRGYFTYTGFVDEIEKAYLFSKKGADRLCFENEKVCFGGKYYKFRIEKVEITYTIQESWEYDSTDARAIIANKEEAERQRIIAMYNKQRGITV